MFPGSSFSNDSFLSRRFLELRKDFRTLKFLPLEHEHMIHTFFCLQKMIQLQLVWFNFWFDLLVVCVYT